MSDMKVTFIGLEEFRRRMLSAPEIVKSEMTEAVDRVTNRGLAGTRKIVNVDKGLLRGSLTATKATFIGGEARGSWGTNVPYARDVEEGTPPGRRVSPDALVGWLRRKGTAGSNKSLYPLAVAVSDSIFRVGTRSYRFMARSKREIAPVLRDEFSTAAKRIASRMGG